MKAGWEFAVLTVALILVVAMTGYGAGGVTGETGPVIPYRSLNCIRNKR